MGSFRIVQFCCKRRLLHINACSYPFVKNYRNISTAVNQRRVSKYVQDVRSNLIKTFEENDVSEAEESANYIIAQALGFKTFSSIPGHSVINESRVKDSDMKEGHEDSPVEYEYILKESSSSVPDYSVLNDSQLKDINDMKEQRLKHIPVQYIFKEWDFGDLTLAMKPPVFIPRPETEELVDYMTSDPIVSAAKHCIEIGTGTGAISLSLLHKFPMLRCTAFEAGKDAFELTIRNAVSLGLSSRLDLNNLRLAPDTKDDVIKLLSSTEVDFIVSNPPYIRTEDLQVLAKEIDLYEDKLALDGGDDGLNVIRSILELAQRVLKTGGSLWLETDSSHPSLIEKMAHAYELEYKKTIKDFRAFDRFCHLTRK